MKQSVSIFATLLLATVLLSGCANATFNFTDATRPDDTKPNVQEHRAIFFSGFGLRQTIDAAKVCGGADKVASVDVDQSFMDAVIATVTLGIYTPLSARVFCK